jgi:hypothetical protein
MPTRFRLSPEMEEAMLVSELGFPPQVIAEWPQSFIECLAIYKGVKDVALYGGDWQP